MTVLRFVLYFGALQLILAGNVYAYIDMSVGSMLIQAVIAGLVSVGIFWRQLRSFLGRLFGRKKETD